MVLCAQVRNVGMQCWGCSNVVSYAESKGTKVTVCLSRRWWSIRLCALEVELLVRVVHIGSLSDNCMYVFA